MRIIVVLSIFIVSLCARSHLVCAAEKPTGHDSVAVAERKKAIADFRAGKFNIPATRVTCNSFYAEEIFFKISGLKIEFYHDWNWCGTGMEETYFREGCYYSIIDSLMYSSYGADIYSRVSSEGESLEIHDPDRYPSDDDPFALQRIMRTPSDSILMQHVRYPASAKRDSVQGTVLIKVDYDSTGKVTRTSIMKGVRSDLDSAALAGAKYLGRVDPVYRWGSFQASYFAIPIKFALKD